MAAVIYIRIPAEDGKLSVQLVCSKTKVALIKRLTIPRLELAAALLLARLMNVTLPARSLSNICTLLV